MASMSLQSAYDQARQSLESNDLDRAIGLAQHILDAYPDNLEAYRILGETYLANRQLDRAQESFERVLRSDPENIPAHVGLGITSERQNQLERAIAEFELALEIKPDMTEIRGQLLRLYSEGWGSENAQLRLSRAGLARLYAKGHMLPQAISEFRQVIADQPQRFDAKVALAETLWRDGQEEEAIDLCREILEERPESLKANLLLGYLLMSSGRPEGERFWAAAARMDPYQSVAQVLFDPLPEQSRDEPLIAEWDEAAWRSRRLAEQQETLSATRPMEAVTPSGTPAEAEALFASSWLDQAPAPVAPFAEAPAEPSTSMDMDDFLASLLSLDNPPAPTAEDAAGLDAAPTAEDAADLDAAPTAAAEPEMTPFSLADLGLSDDEIAGLNNPGAQPPAAPRPPQRRAAPDTQPFSLADLGLSDEIGGLNDLGAQPPAAPGPPATGTPDLQPFSLADLGLSDEIGGLENMPNNAPEQRPPTNTSSGADTSDDLPPDLQPFSIDELDLSGDVGGAELGGLPPALQPFSLDETPAGSTAAPETFESDTSDDQETSDEPRGYSWQQASQKSEPSFTKPIAEEKASGDLSIFSKLKQQHDSTEPPPPPPLPEVAIEPDEHLGLFSLDDIPLRDDAEAPTSQLPPAKAPEIDNLQDALAAGQVQPFSLADLGLSDEEIAAIGMSQAAAPEPPAPEPQLPPAKAPEIDNLQDALAAGQVQPFSLADLGLSDEEIAAMGMGDAPTPTPPASEPAGQASDFAVEPLADSDVAAGASAGDDESMLVSDLKPFSLADLGLSDEEINALGLSSSDADGEAGLGLTEEELEGLDGGDLNWSSGPSSATTPPSQPEALAGDDLMMTSGDLVLDQLIALGRQQGYIDIADIIANVEDPEAEADRIEEIGQRLHEARIEIRDGDEVIDMDAEYAESDEEFAQPDEPAPIAEPPATPRASFPRDLDLLADDAGTATDAPDVGPTAGEPSMAPFSLADLGLSEEEMNALGLNDAGAPSPEPQAEVPAEPAEPNMAPFSLNELGLSDDEIASLGLNDAGAPSPEPQAEVPAEPAEPNMAPFSLNELGLSDDEIASLGLAAAPAEAAAEPTAPEPAIPPVASEPPVEPIAEPPAASAPPVAPESPTAAAPARPPRMAEAAQITSTGNDVLDAFLRQLEGDPDNDVLRLSVARVVGQIGMPDLALKQYRYLVKHNRMLDQVAGELQDLIAYSDDPRLLPGLHRVLGDVYSKQGRLREAIDEYSWTLGGPRGTR